MTKKLIAGSAVALVTPFKEDHSLDKNALRHLVQFHIAGGTDIVIPCGTTGESPTLTADEQSEIIGIVREEAGNKILVAAGAGTNATNHAVALARNAENAGAQAILSVAPYYNKPSQEGYYEHYSRLAEAVTVPIIVYNVPGRTGSNVTAETILRLAGDHKNIAAVKEASVNINQIMELIACRPANFSVMTGEDQLILPFMALGGDGVISVAANQVPAEIKKLLTEIREGNLEEARDINNRLRKLFSLNFIESNPVPVKYSLSLMGMIKEVYRLPLVPLQQEHKNTMREELRNLGLVN